MGLAVQTCVPASDLWRVIAVGPITIPDDFFGVQCLFGINSGGTIPSFPFMTARSINYVPPGNDKVWSLIEGGPGNYNWQHLDDFVLFHSNAGRKVCYTVVGIPSFAARQGTPFSNAVASSTTNTGQGSGGPVETTQLPRVQLHVETVLKRYNKVSEVNDGRRRIWYLQAQNEPSHPVNLFIRLDPTTVSGVYANGTVADVTTGHVASGTAYNASTFTITTVAPNGAFTYNGLITRGSFTGRILPAWPGLFTSSWCGDFNDLAAFAKYIRLARDNVDPGVKIFGPAWTLTQVSDGNAASFLAGLDGEGGTLADHIDYNCVDNYGMASEEIKGTINALSPQGNVVRMKLLSSKPIVINEYGFQGTSFAGCVAMDGLELLRCMIQFACLQVAQCSEYAWDAGGFEQWRTDANVQRYSARMAGALNGRTVMLGERNTRTGQMRMTYDNGGYFYL